MTLAKRIRDCRYAKGWGPDELASRAEISRTALYQIESGKTELPRAGTLRRIAKALDVPIEVLLGTEPRREPPTTSMTRYGEDVEGRFAVEHIPSVYQSPAEPRKLEGTYLGPRPTSVRERELAHKFHEVLASPWGEGVARIVEQTYEMLPLRQAK